MTYLSRGRHHRPTPTRRRAVTVAAAGGAAVLAPVVLPGAASAASPGDTLAAIAACESSGNPRSVGPVTAAGGHFGLYQFDLPTWQSVGGSGNPAHASAAEQTGRAAALLSDRGTQPWLASQHCWGDDVAPIHVDRVAAPHAAAARATPAARVHATVTVRRGDTLANIAAAHGVSWRSIFDRNRAVIGDNPALIVPGQRLAI